MPYSVEHGARSEPKLAVSTTSTPTAKKASCIAGDDVGPGEAEHLVAALELGAAEVVGRQVEALDEGAEGAVEDDDALVDRVEEGLVPPFGQRYRAYLARSWPVGWPARAAMARQLDGCRPGRAVASPAACLASASTPKAGDDGTTGLFYGGRVRKDSELPAAYGTVDEAQAVLGLARADSPARRRSWPSVLVVRSSATSGC